MSQTEESFNAVGKTVVAFETLTGDRSIGVVAWGSTCGIHAEGLSNSNDQTGRAGALRGTGVHGRGDLVGVSGEGPVGVSGEGKGPSGVGVNGTGTTGLTGIGHKVGVVGETDSITGFSAEVGVSGKGPVGVRGTGLTVGVVGEPAADLGPGMGPNPFAEVGVSGKGPIGVRGTGLTVGVSGKGPVGVRGTGLTVGVVGETETDLGPLLGPNRFAEVGVSGKGPVGVRGESNVKSDGSIGVEGTVQHGTGIVGQSEEGNAGSFSSKRVAQIHLDPLSISTPVGNVSTPVGNVRGKGGDLLVTNDSKGNATLWFCVRDGDATKAVWKQIA